MKISNKYHNILTYSVDGSYINPDNKYQIARLGYEVEPDLKTIWPTINIITNVYNRSKKDANQDITYQCSFFSSDLNKTIIKYKALLSFDFIAENQDKDYLDLKEIYEEGFSHMKDFIIKNSLKYAEHIAFHPYSFTQDKDHYNCWAFMTIKNRVHLTNNSGFE